LKPAYAVIRKSIDIHQLNLKLDEVRSYYQDEYLAIDTLYKQALEIESWTTLETKEDGKRNYKAGSKFNDILLSIIAESKSLNDLLQPYLKDEEAKKAIESLNSSIASDKKGLTDIVYLTTRIQERKKLLEDCKTEIFKIYENSYMEYICVIDALKDRTVELEKDGLAIVGKAQFNFPKFRKQVCDISDGRSASYTQYSTLRENKKATDIADFTVISDEVKRLFDDVVHEKYVLTNKTTIRNAIQLILDDYFFDYWEITYKSDKLGEMSTGKASFVILMLIIGLSKSKAPILIDQPEDNLDNRSITTDLVNYLRNKKLERQIMIVTHNANIVINADAENVIVANQKGQNDDQSTSTFKFDYINGAIENSFEKIPSETDILKAMGIRQHIADVVEGGKEAFIMREKKYRFH
jgi:predicted ATP-dependent endonuclease of OLD family